MKVKEIEGIRAKTLSFLPNAYCLLDIINVISNQLHACIRFGACRLPGTTVPWANLYRCNTYTGSTVYSTPVMCSARLYVGNVVDQTSTLTVLS